MKVRLLHRDQDFDPGAPLVWNHESLVRDLELERLFSAMSRDDGFVHHISRRILLGAEAIDVDTVLYRQDALADSRLQPGVIRSLYALATEAVALERRHYLGTLSRYPNWLLRWGLEMIEDYLRAIKALRDIVDYHGSFFRSEAFAALVRVVRVELDDDYLDKVRSQIADLKFSAGATFGASLGPGLKGRDYRLHRTRSKPARWWEKWAPPRPGPFGFSIHPRDEAGARALEELRARGIIQVARALAQSADHIRDFFIILHAELAFYVGCLNLDDALAGRGDPLTRPNLVTAVRRRIAFRNLRDLGLLLAADGPIIGNDLPEGDPRLVVITGANQGGKSTFLRSVAIAQLMMQAGMSVAADQFESSLCSGVFTHHRREEDATMNSGKLEEELKRTSEIIDHLDGADLILFNESFATTNEREGTEIARQIITGLLEHGARVICVTHLYELARLLAENPPASAAFLRAERKPDGSRPFRLVEGAPLETSYGEDLYLRIFAEPLARSSAEAEHNRSGALNQD